MPSTYLYQKDERELPENIHKSLFIICFFFSSVKKCSISLVLILLIARIIDIALVINQQ